MSVSQVEWSQVAEEFRPDGALRDIYVLDASIADWQSVYDAVRAAYPVVLRDSQTLPSDVEELFRHDAGVTLSVDPEGLDAVCHFLH